MENSANEALIIGAYVFVFVIALSSAVYLFHSVYKYSELAYKYENNIGKGNLVSGIPSDNKIIMNGTDVMSYIFNYNLYDAYTISSSITKNYNVKILNKNDTNIFDLSHSSYSALYNLIDLNEKYELKYVSIDKGNDGNITSAEIDIVEQK